MIMTTSSGMGPSSVVRMFLIPLILQGMLVGLFLPEHAEAMGGEKAFFTTTMFDESVMHRQNVCDRYDLVRDGKLELRDALRNMTIRPVIAVSHFFNYDPETGIDPVDPGLEARLMDALAERAGFEWRNSFGVTYAAELNRTFTELLVWSIETYDIAVNWWDQSVERMEMGAAFIEPWFDGSIILIDQEDPEQLNNEIKLLNWTLPYEPEVWIATILTVLISALAFQLIEYLNNEREERSISQWFRDNLYLSSLNFTQNYEFAPNSSGGRILGVSMGIWAMVMVATYTANLASLFVEDIKPPIVVESLDQAVSLSQSVCTYANTNADFLLKRKYKNLNRVPKPTELESYQALRNGECHLTTAYKDNWEGNRGVKEFNPDCDLKWIGRTVEVIKSGLAVKADSGNFCTGFIRDVLNLYMAELISEGVLGELWKEHRAKSQDIDCDAKDAAADRRNMLELQPNRTMEGDGISRKLKAAAKAGSSTTDGEATPLSLRQMAGTFVLHYALMLCAILVCLFSTYYAKFHPEGAKDPNDRRTFRNHGPIIGSAPAVNTYARDQSRKALEYAPSERRLVQTSASTEEDETRTFSEDDKASLQPDSRRTRTVAFSKENGVSDKGDISSGENGSGPSERGQEQATQQQDLSQQLQTVVEMIQAMKTEMAEMKRDVDATMIGGIRTKRVLGSLAQKLDSQRSIESSTS